MDLSKSNRIMFKKREYDEYTLVCFRCSILTPEVLKVMRPPMVNKAKGVLLSGRGPIWLYGALVHHYHPTRFVMVYEPRGEVGIVVESHHPDYEVGDTVYVGRKVVREVSMWEEEENRR